MFGRIESARLTPPHRHYKFAKLSDITASLFISLRLNPLACARRTWFFRYIVASPAVDWHILL